MAHINIIARTNGVGLDRDVDIVYQILIHAGHTVTVSHAREISPLRVLFPGEARFDANIFLERIFSRWLGTAKKNILIPNQERFPKRYLGLLKKIDHVFCKSRHAEDIFTKHQASSYIGFTSKDRQDQSVEKDYQSFLHLAGKSTLKGTEVVLQLWSKHPEWPELTLIQCKANAPASVPSNIRLITDYLSDEEINHHMNAHGIHLCPSLSEGWGHYIVEAMSCRAVVITTDAPPMNELVTPATGVPVPYSTSQPRHLGTNFHIDPHKMEQNIIQLLQTPPSQKQHYGSRARDWFEKNDARFAKSFIEPLEKNL